MKNLFKNLMLVAVAAMAFTACTETNDEVNAVSKTTRYEFTANIAEETRSGFAEKEEGATAYKSEWFGGEVLRVYVTNDADFNESHEPSIDKDGKFVVDLTDAPESFSMTILSPKDSWANPFSCTIPTVQTPLENSVDPAAHLLWATNVPVNNGVADINMAHKAAYGKMTVNAPDFEISKVEVSFNGGQVYTLNATHVKNNVFWFTTEPMDVEEFTVTAYDAEDNAITKTVDVVEAGKTLAFINGRVSTFSVSGLEEVVEPEGLVYTAAEMIQEYSTNDVMVSFTGEGLEEMQINFYGAAMVSGSLNVGTFTIGVGLYSGYCFYGETQLKTITIGSTFEDGVYKLVFSNLTDNGGNVVVDGDITFTGLISGLAPVDLRTQLAKPSVTATVSGKTITLRWDPVEGAEGYCVKLFSPYDEYFEEIVDDEEYVYVAQLSNQTYAFTIMSYASDTNAQYRSSEDAYAYPATEDTDPKMELSESALSFTADGGEKTFTVTLKNTDAAIEYTQEGDWFTVAFSGDTFTVNASANESETDAREGSITVTAGTLLQTIDVTQSKKSAVSTDGADGTSVDKAYTFTTYSTYDDLGGYPVMCLSGAENGATFNFESNTSGAYPTGMHKFNDGAWYPALCEYKINGEAQAVDFVNSVIWVEGNNVSGYTVEYIYIVTDGGNGIYYKYDGKFFI